MKRAVDSVLEAIADHPDAECSWLIGVPWFEPPDALRVALKRAASEMRFDYPPIEGSARFREAVKKLHAGFGQKIALDQILPTHGAKGALLAVFATILEPGDELLHPSPCYPAYPAMAKMLGAIAVPVEQSGGVFSWDRSALENRITARTRALVLSSPANPNGATLGDNQARFLVEFCRDHHVRLICDEAYEAFRFAEKTAKSPAFWDPDLQTVVQVRSVSKTYALCGWRLGYLVGDRELITRAKQWQSSMLNPPNGLAQQAMASVGEVPQSYFEENWREARRRVNEVASALRGTVLSARVPEGGFYLWARIESGSSVRWCVELARNQGVALWPGEDFGAPGWVRISVSACAPERWQNAVERIGDIR